MKPDNPSQLAKRLKDQIAKTSTSTIGAWLTVGSSQVCEALLSTECFAWAAVDLEHSSLALETVENLFRTCASFGVTPLVRLPSHDVQMARRLLDVGAAGFIVPMVESASALSDFFNHLTYAPHGQRGVCLSRMNRWGDDFDEYRKTFAPVVVAQIESKAGIEALEAVCKLTFVDALFVGPYDLSSSLGKPGDFESIEFAAASKRIIDVSRKNQKPLGLHVVEPSVELLRGREKEGYRFIAFSTDMIMMRSATRELRQTVSGKSNA